MPMPNIECRILQSGQGEQKVCLVRWLVFVCLGCFYLAGVKGVGFVIFFLVFWLVFLRRWGCFFFVFSIPMLSLCVLVPDRVRLLLDKDSGCYTPKRDGQRKRKSVRGCIVSRDIAVLHLIVAKRGKEAIPDLTNKVVPRRLGPKRANNIRKLFNLTKEDDVRQFVVRREIPSKKEGGKPKQKAPKIQRLITPERLQRKRQRSAAIKKQKERSKQQAQAYAALLAQRKQEKRAALVSKKSRLSTKKSEKKSEKKQ